MRLRLQLFFTIYLFFAIISNGLYAQGETNIWYFGDHAGFDFGTNPPTALNNGNNYAFEGSSTISDKSGSLLFYTDGVTSINIYNKNHAAMLNGVGLTGGGGPSGATQNSVIVPYPGTYNVALKRYDKYYIITVGDTNSATGIRYSEIDMTLDGGLGGVTSNKNILLYGTNTTEKVCVVKHSNNCDFWLVTKPVGSPDYNVFLVNTSGIITTAVVSSPGPTSNPCIGSLKSSSNNRLVAAAYSASSGNGGVYVYDFDNTTGSMALKFSSTASLAGEPYGLEFSPDNTKVYATALTNRSIYQYNLTMTTNALFNTSRQVVGTTTIPLDANGYTVCALQLAPNGKIYAALSETQTLGVIDNPNLLGTAANYIDQALTIAPGVRRVELGLPNFATNLIKPINQILVTNACTGSMTGFNTLDTSDIISYAWSFATTTAPSTPIYTATGANPTHNFTAGNYIATVVNTYACGFTDTLTKTFTILQSPNATTTTVTQPTCTTATGIITATAVGGSMYSFDNGVSYQASNVSNPLAAGTYQVKIKNSVGCESIATATVINAQPVRPLAPTTSVTQPTCITSRGIITVTLVSGSMYSFDNGVNYQISNVSNLLVAGTYQVKIKNSVGCESTATSTTINAPNVTPVPTPIVSGQTICAGSTATLTATGMAGSTFKWYDTARGSIVLSNSATFTTPILTDTKTYYVDQTNSGGCVSTTRSAVTVTVIPYNLISIDDTILCEGQINTILDAGTGFLSYLWSTGAVTQSITATTVGNYTVTVKNIAGCYTSKTINIGSYAKPKITNIVIDKNKATIFASGEFSPFQYSLDMITWQTSNVFSNLQTGGVFQAYVKNNMGCTSTRSFGVLNIPNIITPNGDGINDTWVISGLDAYPQGRVLIYDRYGKILVDSNALNFSWNGSYLGKSLPSSDYWYMIDIKTTGVEKVTGHITVRNY